MNRKNRCLSLLSLLTILPLGALAAPTKTLPGHVPPAVRSLSAKAELPATHQLDLGIGVPLRDPAGLSRFLGELYDPASTNFHRYLTPDQFTQRFGPTEQDYQTVIDFARSNGFAITHTYSNRVLLDVRGKTATVEKAFHIKLHTYRHPTESRDFFAPDTEPTVPTGVPMLQVSGLSDYWQLHHHSQQQPVEPGQGSPRNGSGSAGLFFADDFRRAYAPGTTLTGAGQIVGLVQFDGYYTNDIANYAAAAGGGRTNVVIEPVMVNGFTGVPTGNSGQNLEVSLDIEMAMAMAPGLSRIVVFEAPNSLANFNSLLNAMAGRYEIKNLSCSWGGGGPNPTAEMIFQQMAAQGQSFFNASGDSDAFTGSVPFPSDSTNITQVGGTSLVMNGAGASYASESVWNWGNSHGTNYDGNGSSGGVSTYYTIPSWQQTLNMVTNGGSTTMRNIPDVAMAADQILVYYNNGSTANARGTSCAAPLWAGFMALANQRAAATGHAAIGFVNPSLYAIGAGTNYTACFNDITNGNNFWSSSPTNFPAVPGYDLCTGWGSPGSTNLIEELAGLATPWEVYPANGFSSTGSNGGPFTITSAVFQLINSSSNSFAWNLTGVPAWLNAVPTNGTLAAGTQTNVVLSLSSVAANLPVGNYHSNLVFSNLTAATTQTLPADLVIVYPTIVVNGGFETGDFTGWSLVGNTTIGTMVYNGVVSAGSITGGADFIHSGIYGAFLGDNSLATWTQSLNTVPGQLYFLSFWLTNPQAGAGQQFIANWITNGTGTNQLLSFNNPPVIPWTNFTFFLTATTTNTMIQFAGSNPPNGWGLDDVVVTPIPAPALNSLTRIGNSLVLNWRAFAGLAYQVQYKTNLLQSNWINFDPITATNWSISVTDTNAASAPARFYRAVQLP
ncbi:MAG TPA: protease pro-enzyme activation domain-containing protein [Verrucomicrobiae bacterium]